jgi:hypothetical protein
MIQQGTAEAVLLVPHHPQIKQNATVQTVP